jgi:hypothetical protein
VVIHPGQALTSIPLTEVDLGFLALAGGGWVAELVLAGTLFSLWAAAAVVIAGIAILIGYAKLVRKTYQARESGYLLHLFAAPVAASALGCWIGWASARGLHHGSHISPPVLIFAGYGLYVAWFTAPLFLSAGGEHPPPEATLVRDWSGAYLTLAYLSFVALGFGWAYLPVGLHAIHRSG